MLNEAIYQFRLDALSRIRRPHRIHIRPLCVHHLDSHAINNWALARHGASLEGGDFRDRRLRRYGYWSQTEDQHLTKRSSTRLTSIAIVNGLLFVHNKLTYVPHW